MTDLSTVTGAAAALRRGDTTAENLVERAIGQADKFDGELGVFLSRYIDQARLAARAADEKIARGDAIGVLEGIPLGLKDIISESQGPTTAQSLVLDRAWGAGIGDAVAVSRLKRAGGIVMGKTTTMEFAAGAAPDPSKPFPVARNPWDPDCWAGGSSSGSGSGVAAGMFLAALGTDTGGSVRIPAAFDGITGLKPTFGRVPKHGVVPVSHTIDTVGPMARSAADCALLLSVIAGHDERDSCSVPVEVDDYVSGLNGDLSGVRIGVDDLDRYATGGIDPAQPAAFAQALASLEAAGAELVPVQVPMYHEAIAALITVAGADMHAYHRSDLRSRWNDYGQAARIMLSGSDVVSGADYVQAQRVRRLVHQKLDELFAGVALVVTPTAHLAAPRIDAMRALDPFGFLASVHAGYWNPGGHPTLALPIGLTSEHMPLSLSISGPLWSDALVLRAGDALQRRTTKHLDQPPAYALSSAE